MKKAKSDLSGYEKKVISSLISPTKAMSKPQKEEKEENMRCRIDIIEGVEKRRTVETFIKNTNSLRKLILELEEKYGQNVQCIITNLYNEEVVAKRLIWVGQGNA